MALVLPNPFKKLTDTWMGKPKEQQQQEQQMQESFGRAGDPSANLPSGKQIFGENPLIKFEDFYKPVNVENPYEQQLKAALSQNTAPDFARAQTTAGQQGQFAQALQGLYGTGAAGLTGLIGTLQRQQGGDFGPGGSLAQKILEQGLGQNIAGVRSQLASQRGLSPALAARYAAQQTAQLGGQTAQQAGILGLQQQLGAQQLLGQLTSGAAQLGSKAGEMYGQMRTQDIAQATATSDAALKRLSTLAASDTGIKELQAKTGISENEIRAKVAAANQAAKMGDRQMAADILGGITGAFAQAGAKSAFKYSGGRIDGQALVPGDSPKNDVVPINASPGEIIIPRSAATSPEKAKAFIDALDDWDEEPSYGKVLKARQKKSYAEGGVVEPDYDQKLLDRSRAAQLQKSYEAPVPGVERFKQGLDTMLTENVVEPLARRGYPNLGAGIATVPSTLAEALLPSSMAEMQTVLKLPGLGKTTRGVSESLAQKETKMPEFETLKKVKFDEESLKQENKLFNDLEKALKERKITLNYDEKIAAKAFIEEKLSKAKYYKLKNEMAQKVGGVEDFEEMPSLYEYKFRKGEVPSKVSDFWLLMKEHQPELRNKFEQEQHIDTIRRGFPDYRETEYRPDISNFYAVDEELGKLFDTKGIYTHYYNPEHSAQELQRKMYKQSFQDLMNLEDYESIIERRKK